MAEVEEWWAEYYRNEPSHPDHGPDYEVIESPSDTAKWLDFYQENDALLRRDLGPDYRIDN
jgi:hypothetical protein